MTGDMHVETDLQLRDAVICQLDWNPDVDTSGIGVSAADGVVTLTGFIDSYAGKLAAERAVKRIHGVRGVANDIVVRLRQARTDDRVACDAVRALANPPSLADRIQVAVHQGRVTLTGEVDWHFQQQLAETLVRHVSGVADVHNYVSVAAHADPQPVSRAADTWGRRRSDPLAPRDDSIS